MIKNKLKFLSFIVCFTLLGCMSNNLPNIVTSTSSGYIDIRDGHLFYQKFGSGRPIIVIHGGPGLDQNYLMPQMLELAKDHELIFYDQRGSGKSLDTKFDPDYINLEQFTQDLKSLQTSLKIQKPILLAHSWGGLLATNYVVKYPNEVSAMILMNSAPADCENQREFLNEFAKRTDCIKDTISPIFDFKKFEKLDSIGINKLYRDLYKVYFFDPQKLDELNLNMNVTSARSGHKVMTEMLKTAWLNPKSKLIDDLKNVKVPTLVIHADYDIVLIEGSKKLVDTIPNSKFFNIKECGHFAYVEKPDELFDEIRKFLAEAKAGLD